jgi:hypothetical protein
VGPADQTDRVVKTGYYLGERQRQWLRRQARTRSDATDRTVTESQVLREAVQAAMDREQTTASTA